MGIERLLAFFAMDPKRSMSSVVRHRRLNDMNDKPWLNSKLLESRTTLVQRKLRSLDAVSSCLPSSP